MSISRRTFLELTPAAFVPLTAIRPAPGVTFAPQAAPVTTGLVDASFPSHPATLSREMVIAAHGNVTRVRELLARWPMMSRAALDWGFGDWEDALGAASHTGRREIADLLIANGARPTIFSAAMLGQLDVVKTFIAATPGVESIHGPHSITLLRHAAAGGQQAQAVLEYLKTLPGADRKPEPKPIAAEELSRLVGTYTFGLSAEDKLIVELSGQNFSIGRPGRSARNLVHLGDLAFYPIGATEARVRFGTPDGKRTVSVFDPDLLVSAVKVE